MSELSALVFYVIAGVILLSALAVVFSRNIMHSALFLVLCFLGIAACFFQLDAGFLGMVQILVYAGAVSVLMIFAVMLVMNQRSDATNPDLDSPVLRVLALALPATLLAGTGWVIYNSHWPTDKVVPMMDEVGSLARMMLGDYVIAFEIAAVLLLVAVVGAILLAKGDEEPC